VAWDPRGRWAVSGVIETALAKDMLVKKRSIIALIMVAVISSVYLIVRQGEEAEKPASDSFQTKTRVRQKDGMVLVYIPAGEFEMGSSFAESVVPTGDLFRGNFKVFFFPDQRPKHRVCLDAYWIDQTEVTVGMFRKFVEDTAYETTAEKEGWGKPWREGPKEDEWPKIPGTDWRHPRGPESVAADDQAVSQISWEDAMAYCAWVGGQLPTEAQWEKAARGTDGRRFPWGDEFDGTRLNYGDAQCPVERWRDLDYDDGHAHIAPVGSYPQGASPYGVLDMAGNVWEWVADWYDKEYYRVAPYRSPTGPESGTVRAQRGGSWYDGEAEGWVNCLVRHQNPPTDRYDDVGFRCVIPATNHDEPPR